MTALKKIPYDLSVIAETFKLERSGSCSQLDHWLGKSYELTTSEQTLLENVLKEIQSSIDYLNEEEMKIRLIAPLFQVANIDEGNAVRVFYERSLSAEVDGHQLSVIADCMVASSTIFKTPTHPYFFLQEFKKTKGEKRAEAQMLVAMLAAQKANNDGKTIYGGFLIGPLWRLATLTGNEYCTSRLYYATDTNDLQQIAFALRHLKALILNG